MKEQELINKIENQASIFKSRKIIGHGDAKRHDTIKRDEQEWMWTAQNKLGWSYDKIGSVFSRDARSVKSAIERYKPPGEQYQKTIRNPVLIKHFNEIAEAGIGKCC